MALVSPALLAIALIALPIGYWRLCRAMRQAVTARPPKVHFFFVFGSVGGLLLTFAFAGSVLSAFMFLIPLLGALIILASSFFLYPRHRDTRFHHAAFWSGMTFLLLLTVLLFTASLLESRATF
jgi:hypothetical protein